MEIINTIPSAILYAKTGQFEKYRETAPDFFEHYDKYWGDSSKTLRLNSALLEQRADWVIGELQRCEALFARIGHPLSNISALLVVGSGSANGHAMLAGDQATAWFCLEEISSPRTARVFALHELLHAIHYSRSPSSYFSTRAKRDLCSRQLICEGIATYGTASLHGITLDEALWADYLPESTRTRWMTDCRTSFEDLRKYAKERFRDRAPEGLFTLADLSDIKTSRGGYFLGALLVEALCKRGISLAALIDLPIDELTKLVWDELRS